MTGNDTWCPCNGPHFEILWCEEGSTAQARSTASRKNRDFCGRARFYSAIRNKDTRHHHLKKYVSNSPVEETVWQSIRYGTVSPPPALSESPLRGRTVSKPLPLVSRSAASVFPADAWTGLDGSVWLMFRGESDCSGNRRGGS